MTPNPAKRKLLSDWEFYNLKDAFTERPKPMYVVKGLLRVPSLSIFFGAPETFKSMLLVDMAACVAAGSPWLPADDKDVQRATIESPVMICDFDQGRYESHNRIAALARARKLTEDDGHLFHYVSMPEPRLDASNQDHTIELADTLQQKELEIKLLVIDNLRLISGSIDENNSEMSTVMNNLRRLSDDIDAAVVVIHHQRKMRQRGTRRGDALRGHSSIEASLDLAILVEETRDENIVKLTPTKRRFARIKPFAARFQCKRKPDSAELEEASFSGLRADSIGKTGQIRRAVVAVLTETPGMNQSQIVQAVKDSLNISVGRKPITDTLQTMCDEQKLVRQIGDRGAHEHYLPEQVSDD